MTNNVKVPFADLYAQYLSLRGEIDHAIESVIKQSAFIRGRFVENFEKDFSGLLGVPYCVSCGNGTDALYIAMHSLGLRAGDEVITTAHSWIATSETITQAGGKVVFCDTDKDTYTIDPSQIEAKITSRTVGLIPVHLFGQPADMDPIMAVARKHGLWVLEDCAQAHFAKYKGKTVGTFGNAAAFSFYPGKNLGAMGDAGAIVTADRSLADKMAMFARHGGLIKGDHQIEGVNSRMDGIHAAVLSVKLRHIFEWTRLRQDVAAFYDSHLSGVSGIVPPKLGASREHVYHLYVVKCDRRDALKNFLSQEGIETVINYPVALPFLPAYARLGHIPNDFPNAHSQQSKILSLPIFPEITAEQREFVVAKIRQFISENSNVE